MKQNPWQVDGNFNLSNVEIEQFSTLKEPHQLGFKDILSSLRKNPLLTHRS